MRTRHMHDTTTYARARAHTHTRTHTHTAARAYACARAHACAQFVHERESVGSMAALPEWLRETRWGARGKRGGRPV